MKKAYFTPELFVEEALAGRSLQVICASLIEGFDEYGGEEIVIP